MALYPKAAHKLFGGHDGPMSAHLGFVLHVNDSNGNLDNWVRDQNHDMSCHFEVYKDGTVTQYVDTAYASWCQMDGNATYVSIETEGYPAEALTAAQVAAIAGIVAWGHTTHGIPLQLADKVGQRGLGWHGMGGAAWGGHTGCPGDKRKAQRKGILAQAAALLKPAPVSVTPHPVPAQLYREAADLSAPVLVSPGQHAIAFLDDNGQLHIHKDHHLLRTI